MTANRLGVLVCVRGGRGLDISLCAGVDVHGRAGAPVRAAAAADHLLPVGGRHRRLLRQRRADRQSEQRRGARDADVFDAGRRADHREPAACRALAHARCASIRLPASRTPRPRVRVRSDYGVPLFVERTMFWDSRAYAGHTGSAVEQPSTDWFFAEGSQGFFDTFLLVINPNGAPTNVTFHISAREQKPRSWRPCTSSPITRLTVPSVESRG